jgi:hypothetical protein
MYVLSVSMFTEEQAAGGRKYGINLGGRYRDNDNESDSESDQ